MANDSDNGKKWNRPWSTEEIIESADNWSLAGDVALLNSIKAYADNLLTKTISISNNVDDLLNGLNQVGLELEISHNEFQSLRNTQFIESRVYEDDETLDVQEAAKEKERTLTEEENLSMIKKATAEGLRVMDKYFDKIEVSISDSEEESETSYVLQPKDLYVDRPLPLVIGTEDWYKKWHVGLADTSSEDESDKASEIYSESDSDDHLPKDLLRGSETSSELDFSSHTSESRPVANSTFNESTKQPNIFESDESDEQGSLPVKAPISNKNFAEQLAEKLGNVMSEREDVFADDVNKRPIQPAPPNRFVGNLFSDEPPPLDDLDDTILPKSAETGLFSGGRGLFDDNEDELFWEQRNRSLKVDAQEKKVEIPPNTYKNASPLPKPSQVSKGLFDSDESSEEDLFASNKKALYKPPFLQPYKTAAPLFDEEPPALDTEKKKAEEELTRKKPITSMTEEESGREKNVKSKPISLFDDDVDNKVEAEVGKLVSTKKINLFDDDDDDLFKEDLFSNFTTKKPTLNLLDVEDSDDVKVNIPNKPKVTSLFSDTDEEEESLNVSKTIDVHSQGDLADTKETIEVSNDKFSEKTNEENDSGESLIKRQVIGAENNATRGLFDNVEDDLFKGVNTLTPKERPQLEVTVPTPEAKATKRVEGISLFGSSPPPDDGDDWDVKSDNFSDGEDQFSYRIDANTNASSLFDNEPPSLGPNESSGIVRDQNLTRIDTDDSSFYPYASSSRRLSSDIFGEQQSQDSLFITKSRTESIIVPPLDIIPEDTKASFIDITPSGNPSDLEDTTSENFTASSGLEKNLLERPKRPVSLFDDDDYDYSENLFSTHVKEEPSTQLFENAGDISGENARTENENTTKYSETSKEATKSPPGKSKIANLIDRMQSDSVEEQPTLPGSSPRKLKHNLNINVNALLPGSAPPKLKNLTKSHSLDFPKELEEDPSEDFSAPDSALFMPQTSSRSQAPGTNSGKVVSFDDALDNVNVLHSITKDRAKIPIKRRPSTRRGRREAITRSAVDLIADNDDILVSGPGMEIKVDDGSEKSQTVVVGVDGTGPLGKEDLCDLPTSKSTAGYPLAEAASEKPTAIDIFKDGGDSDDNLFPNLPGKKAKISSSIDQPKGTIFGSEDSDGDLFGVTGPKKSKKERKGVTSKSENSLAASTKKSLFNDSSSDDDLFSGSNKGGSRTKVPVQSKPAGKKTQKVSTLRKLENIETDDDPLSSLLK